MSQPQGREAGHFQLLLLLPSSNGHLEGRGQEVSDPPARGEKPHWMTATKGRVYFQSVG